MSNNRLMELISRKLSGEATTEELDQLDEMLLADAEALERFKLLEQFWTEHDNARQLFVEEAFEKLKLKLNARIGKLPKTTKRQKKSFLPGLIAAASVVLIACSVFFIKRNANTAQQPALSEKKNSPGVKSFITLADGTRVWLNADSKIQYPKKFTGDIREVYLDGEAFFDVTKNAVKPFIIHLNKGTIKVLGTSFNIRAYKNEKMIEASVATGKVAFIATYKTGKKHDTVFVTRDNKLRYLLAKEQAVVVPTVSKDDIAWIDGKLVFKAMSFDEIGVELGRTFGKKFIFLSDTARRFRLTGSFRNNSLEEILFYLSKSTEFKYKINKDEVMISDGSTSLRY